MELIIKLKKPKPANDKKCGTKKASELMNYMWSRVREGEVKTRNKYSIFEMTFFV